MTEPQELPDNQALPDEPIRDRRGQVIAGTIGLLALLLTLGATVAMASGLHEPSCGEPPPLESPIAA